MLIQLITPQLLLGWLDLALKDVQKTYEEFGRQDPLFAVLSDKKVRGRKWDPDKFFATGRKEINAAMDYLADLNVNLTRGRALDFGCAVGRLSQALCDQFEEVVGVDISYTMIEQANQFNQFGNRCRFLVNTAADLSQLEDSSFDFVYSNITLQHSPPEASASYIAEFFRLLRPGGVAFFQVPNGPKLKPGSLRARFYHFKRGHWRRLWKRIRGKHPVEIHYLNQQLVEDLVCAHGGSLVQTIQPSKPLVSQFHLFYCAIKK